MKNTGLLLLIGVLIISCSPSGPLAGETTVNNQPADTLSMPAGITETVDLVITASPEPPTPTLEKLPEQTFVIWTSAEVIQAFKEARLDVGDAWVMTKEDHGLDPIVVLEGTRFLIPSLCVDCSGRIFSFGDEKNLEMAVAYYEEFAKISLIYFSWLFVRDNILVQITGNLPEETAFRYDLALQSLK